MESHQYYEPNKYYEDFIAVYSRVSTAQQDIQKQILLAESYIHNNRIDLDKVIWLKDDNVSANKLAIEDRPDLQKLRLLIQQKKVKTVIVYSRDRLARNFYEYVAIVKEFYKYGIKVIFTSTKQPPFSPKLSIEALYGIFAQVEGQNISGRRKDTMKQFPSSIFGYKRIGKRKDVKYIPNPEVVNDLKSFFYEVAETNEADDLFNIIMKYKKILKNKRYEDLLKYLENPFYSAHMKTSYGFEVLHHVEPIISLEEHLKIQEVLKKLKDEVFQAITNAKDRGYITPQCIFCKKDMTFKTSKLGESSYYICKRKHEEIRITVEQLNENIQSKLSIIIKQNKDHMDSPFILRDLIYCNDCKEKLITKNSTPVKSKKKYMYYCCPSCKKKISSKKIHESIFADFSLRWGRELKYYENQMDKILKRWKKGLEQKINDLNENLEKLKYLLSTLDKNNEYYLELKEIFEMQIHSNTKELQEYHNTREQIDLLSKDEMQSELIGRFKQDIHSYSNEEKRAIFLLAIEKIGINFSKDNHIRIDYRLTPYVEIEDLMKQLDIESA